MKTRGFLIYSSIGIFLIPLAFIGGCANQHYASLNEIYIGMAEGQVKEVSETEPLVKNASAKVYRCWLRPNESSKGALPYLLGFTKYKFTSEEVQGVIDRNNITDPNSIAYLFFLCEAEDYWLAEIVVDEVHLTRVQAAAQANAAAFGAAMQRAAQQLGRRETIPAPTIYHQPHGYKAYPSIMGDGTYDIRPQ